MADLSRVLSALERIGTALAAASTQTQDDFVLAPSPHPTSTKEQQMPTLREIPPPTARTRRTARPRLLVVSSEHLFLRLPAAAPENLLERMARRCVADWHVILLAEDPLDDGCLGTYPSPRAALAALDHHLHEVGLVADVVDPATDLPAEAGVDCAA